MALCLAFTMLLLLLGSPSSARRNRCLDAAEACTADARCQRLRTEPRLLAFQASCAPAPSAPGGCLQDQVPRCLHAYAGLVGTAITPNYVDNASARVAPWCDCGASGNRREECEAFRGLFTRNRCLDGAMQAFDGGWPPVLQDQLDVHQDPEHSLQQGSRTPHQSAEVHCSDPAPRTGAALTDQALWMERTSKTQNEGQHCGSLSAYLRFSSWENLNIRDPVREQEGERPRTAGWLWPQHGLCSGTWGCASPGPAPYQGRAAPPTMLPPQPCCFKGNTRYSGDAGSLITSCVRLSVPSSPQQVSEVLD
ncbi:GDNF family receptor alpha-4 isoform X2 [Suricata suricatta]|uniref:GDNF family receptor alpha-4 isoform X2 n=1 Tax=Suricata suricatta TaxID=37032 RepID=UPI001156035B|nr:GDNF family receptor alpha-4 isoform X2 [Suricata suricatta]